MAATLEVTSPLPQGVVAVKAQPAVDGKPALWLECEINAVGRYRESFSIRFTGCEVAEGQINVEASVMGPHDGRPSRSPHVNLLRAADPQTVLCDNEAAAWREGAHMRDEEDDA